MPIDRLNNLYRVPTIKKERMPEYEQKKRRKGKSGDKKNDEDNKQKKRDGRIDIRI